jgi:hypothetical protein
MLEIKSHKTGKEIQVYESDLGLKNLRDALLSSDQIGEGWRLPSIEELEQIYRELFLNGQGNFIQFFYWSSTETNDGKALGWGFSGGVAIENSKFYKGQVRLVRDIE